MQNFELIPNLGSDPRRVQRVRTKSSAKVQLLKCAVFWLAGAGWLLPAADLGFQA